MNMEFSEKLTTAASSKKFNNEGTTKMSRTKLHINSLKWKEQGPSTPKKQKLSARTSKETLKMIYATPGSHLPGKHDKINPVKSPPTHSVSEQDMESPPLSPILGQRYNSEQNVESPALSPILQRRIHFDVQRYLLEDDDDDDDSNNRNNNNEYLEHSIHDWSYNKGSIPIPFSNSKDVLEIKTAAEPPKESDDCHSNASTEAVSVKFKTFSFDSVTQALVEDDINEANKLQNLVNLNAEMFFQHIESKMKSNNLPGSDDEARCSWKMFVAFLEKPTTFHAITAELLRLQQDDYLVGKSTLYDLMEIVVDLVRKMMQAEYERRKSIWEGCLNILGNF